MSYCVGQLCSRKFSSMAPKGSLAQKRKREEVASAASSAGDATHRDTAGSLLFKHLIYLYSWGFLSLPYCQKIAFYATVDLAKAGGREYDDLTWMSKLGDSGKYPGNMYNQAMRYLEKPLVGPPQECLLPYRVSPLITAQKPAAILLPHETFATIYHKYPAIWRSRIVETETVLEEFWSAMDGHPLLAHMKLKDRDDDYRSSAVPLRVHGDDTPVTGIGKSWTKMCLFFSWTPLWASSGSMKKTAFL